MWGAGVEGIDCCPNFLTLVMIMPQISIYSYWTCSQYSTVWKDLKFTITSEDPPANANFWKGGFLFFVFCTEDRIVLSLHFWHSFNVLDVSVTLYRAIYLPHSIWLIKTFHAFRDVFKLENYNGRLVLKLVNPSAKGILLIMIADY